MSPIIPEDKFVVLKQRNNIPYPLLFFLFQNQFLALTELFSLILARLSSLTKRFRSA